MKPLVLALALGLGVPVAGRGAEPLPALVRMLGESRDVAVQVDMLRGLRDATQGPGRVAMPAGWEAVELRLMASDAVEVRNLARMLGFKFGSAAALEAMRGLLRDRAADPGQRQEALRALAGIREATLPATLRELLSEPAMRGAAVRALASFDDPATGPALLAAMPSLAGGERRDALNTLASRPGYARALLSAMEAGTVPAKDLTAEVIRQLRSLKDDAVNAGLAKVYGAVRDVPADKQAEIERYKRLYRAGGSTPGEAIRGRAVYAKVCQQCHTLFDVGGKVGPDLTGSNRGDLDYVLQNIVDPNAVIPNEYRASTVDLKDGRVLTGIVRQGDDRVLVIATANETLTLARADVADLAQSELSMMPEGLLQPLADQEVRDLIYYLGRSGQSPMLATADTATLFYNGQDLALWQGGDGLWSVDQGEIVGSARTPLAKPDFLKSDLIGADFRLTAQVKLTPGTVGGAGTAGAGIHYRGEPAVDGSVTGPRVEVGLGRGGGGEAGPDGTAWRAYEILAIGGRIRVAIDGRQTADSEIPGIARQGLIAFALPPGVVVEMRIREPRLEVNPKPGLLTVRER